MNTEQVTEQILSAWEDDEPEAVVEEQPPEEELDASDEPALDEEPEEEDSEPEEEEEEEAGEDAGEADDGDEPLSPFQSDDPEIQAFLAKYQGDVTKALKGASELSHVLGRQGSEKAQLAREVEELRGVLAEAQAFGGFRAPLTEEQRGWIGEAIESGNPAAYVQSALHEGEFDLARAVCGEWAREDPFQANRVGQAIDAAEYRVQNPPPEPVEIGPFMEVVADNHPEMHAYWGQMKTVLGHLGADHPLVQDARSGDFDLMYKAVRSLYDMARLSSVNVQSTKDELQRRNRQDADDARREAVVSSSSASPSNGQTPRQQYLLPGLSLEDFEAEFAKP